MFRYKFTRNNVEPAEPIQRKKPINIVRIKLEVTCTQ